MFSITIKKNADQDVLREWNMEWLTKRIKIR